MNDFIYSGHVKFHSALEPLLEPIDNVLQHPDNYNNGDVESVAESIEVNGMYRPVFVQKSTGYIVAGNHTWEACKMLDSGVIPVVRLELDDEEAVRLMIVDNRTAALAQPDSGRLVKLLHRLEETDTGLAGSAYKPYDIEVLENLAKIPLENDEYGTWPTITIQVPPHVRRAYLKMTREADTDRDRFELLLRLAGWDGTD